jgi:hypothetical protein
MSKYQVERPRHLGEIEGVDEQARVADLSAAAAAHEAAELLLVRTALPCGLLLHGAERSEIALGLDHLLDGSGAERPDQLVLQVYNAHVEAETFHPGARDGGPEAGTLETAAEVALLARVAEARQSHVPPLRAELSEDASDGLCATDRHNGDALGLEVPATTHSERFQSDPVADSLDEHDRGGQVRSLLLVHIPILPSESERGRSSYLLGRDNRMPETEEVES